jgi:cellulose synthase operon protein C
MFSANHFRVILCLLLAAVAAPGAQADEKTAAKARKLLLRGKYAEAADLYAPTAVKDPAAAVGLARCRAAGGRDADAQKTLAAFVGQSADVLAERAAMAFDRGEIENAKQWADEAIRLDDDSLLAHWIVAEIERVTGRLDQAAYDYLWLVRFYNTHDALPAESLRWIGLAAAQRARWNRLSDQFHFLVNELYPEAVKQDPDYWPAHFEAGLLFLEKHNRAAAARQFQAALEINPNAADVHWATALMMLEEREIDKAQASLDRAMEINPRLLGGWLLRADLAWANFQPRETLTLLEEKARPLNPVCEETLGRMAACYLLLDKPAKDSRFARLVAEVTRRNPHAGEFYLALADQLNSRNRHAEAEAYYREAIRVMPQQVGPEAHLGMLCMRIGREDDARKMLKTAIEADPFDVRVKNSLEVLGVLESMKTLDTKRFAVRYIGASDNVLARYAAGHLERVLPTLGKRFGFTPPGKTLVEIFANAQGLDGHQLFSARMVGLPYLGTVAASTGHMVAMTSPGGSSAAQKMSWSRVLTHEMVHVVTLQQTQFNCPHWFTEGLAVWSEGGQRPELWTRLLRERLAKGNLFNLDTLNFGFTRPQSGGDWNLAYCQAALYVDYMLKRSKDGEESPRRMLAAYAEGLETPAAIRRTFGVSQAEFERGYAAFLKEAAAGRALPWPAERDFKQVRKAAREHPKDADAAAALAYAYLERGEARETLESAQAALQLRPKHPLAVFVVASLRVKASKPREAIEMLEGCLDRKSPQPNVLELLASLQFAAKKYDQAAGLYALGERLDPSDSRWTRGLAAVFVATNNHRAAAAALVRLAKADSDDAATRKKLAEMSLDDGDLPAAARWAAEGIAIDATDSELHRLAAESLARRNKYVEAIEEYETTIELQPKSLEPRLALADALVQVGQRAKARKVLEELLKLAPDYAGADVLLESIRERP